jgi:hypothetical protein
VRFLSIITKYLRQLIYKKEGLILVHGLRGSSPWSAGSIAFGSLVGVQDGRSAWWSQPPVNTTGSGKGHHQGHAPNDLKTSH